MGKREIQGGGTLKKSPTVYLTEKEGSKLVGTLRKKIKSTLYAGKFNYLIDVHETDASIRLWDPETKKENEVEIEAGDSAFLKGTTVLDSLMAEVNEGDEVEVIYTGKGGAKPGRKAPFLFAVSVIE